MPSKRHLSLSSPALVASFLLIARSSCIGILGGRLNLGPFCSMAATSSGIVTSSKRTRLLGVTRCFLPFLGSLSRACYHKNSVFCMATRLNVFIFLSATQGGSRAQQSTRIQSYSKRTCLQISDFMIRQIRLTCPTDGVTEPNNATNSAGTNPFRA